MVEHSKRSTSFLIKRTARVWGGRPGAAHGVAHTASNQPGPSTICSNCRFFCVAHGALSERRVALPAAREMYCVCAGNIPAASSRVRPF